VKQRFWLGILAIGLYFATGFYVVGGNEQAAIRRFGRWVKPWRTSGWHYDLPWPFTTRQTVNLAAVRVMTVGTTTTEATAELMPVQRSAPLAFLTGDKNLLLLRATVQYHLSDERLAEFLAMHQQADVHLQRLTTAALNDAAVNSGVDYLHTIGLADLHDWLTRRLQADVQRARLGIEIDRVTLDGAEPPVRVQADFLDVANARNDAAKAAQEARTYAEQRLTAANAEVQRQQERARQDAQSQLATAQGRAARFTSLVAQLTAEADSTQRPYADCRRVAEQRLTLEAWKVILARVTRPMIVHSGQPFDLQFVPSPAP
jgi:membrane protease subunit HflK